MDLELIDDFVTVSDRDSFLTARRMAREEGLLVGGSGGTAVHAALHVAAGMPRGATVVTLIPDSGRAYLSKFYDDTYMYEHGFLDRAAPTPTVGEVLRHSRGEHADLPEMVVIEAHHRVGEAIALMQRYSISQLPVVRSSPPESFADVVGSLHERSLLDRVFKSPDALQEDVLGAMQPPLATVDEAESIDRVFADLSRGSPAVIVASGDRPAGVLTRSDLLEFLAGARGTS
jgi:cystathionine beta-synthase